MGLLDFHVSFLSPFHTYHCYEYCLIRQISVTTCSIFTLDCSRTPSIHVEGKHANRDIYFVCQHYGQNRSSIRVQVHHNVISKYAIRKKQSRILFVMVHKVDVQCRNKGSGIEIIFLYCEPSRSKIRLHFLCSLILKHTVRKSNIIPSSWYRINISLQQRPDTGLS